MGDNFYFEVKRGKLINALEKLGFPIETGRKHDLAKCLTNGGKTTIPRHKKIKREVVQSIAKFLLGKEVKSEDLLKLLC